jgi:hypothetical protein
MDFDAFLASIESPALRAIAQVWDAARGSALLPAWDALRLEELPQRPGCSGSMPMIPARENSPPVGRTDH